jgi:hypothetical protein
VSRSAVLFWDSNHPTAQELRRRSARDHGATEPCAVTSPACRRANSPPCQRAAVRHAGCSANRCARAPAQPPPPSPAVVAPSNRVTASSRPPGGELP